MTWLRNRFHALDRMWLYLGGSLAAMALLIVLLANPQGKSGAAGQELVLYCAAGMIQPVEEIRREYEQAYHVKIQIEPDGSGKLLSKMRVVKDRGDLFLAADQSYIDLARAEGLVAENIPVASIHPVIVTQPGNPKKIATVDDLLRRDVKVVLANPELAAVGKAARQALQPTGEWAELEKQTREFKAKVSLVGTVNEVAQDVKLGAADAGIAWDATARQFGLTVVEAPALQKCQETITLAVLKRTDRPQRALHFARYLSARDKGLEHFAAHHFEPASEADLWADTPAIDLMAGAMLRPAIEQTLKEFEQREAIEIKAVYNGCGILVGQMKTGRLPAAYFSCDVAFMQMVQTFFLEPVKLSANDMVIVVPKGNPKKIEKLADFLQPGLRIGVGHPEKSALGELTHKLFKQQGFAEQLRESGNVKVESPTGDYLMNQVLVQALDAVIVYRSNARNNPENLAQHLDLIELKVPGAQAVQPFAIGKNGDHKQLMRRLQQALESSESRRRFEEIGFHWLGPEAK